MRVAAVVIFGLSWLLGKTIATAGELRLGTNVTLEFASVAAGREILTRRDDFVQRLSPFDRAARLRTDRDVTEEEFLVHVASCVLDWIEAEKSLVSTAWAQLQPQLAPYAALLPPTIYLISTDGREEGGAAYTRDHAIVLGPRDRARAPGALAHLLAHEIFHVLTRHQPELRDRLYACIGFEPCSELEFPAALESRRITNPDAPELRHSLPLLIDGVGVRVIPILFASVERYDVARGGEFFDTLQLRLLVLDPDVNAPRTRAWYENGEPRLIDVSAAPDFLARVGRNTHYIIHPEEILADNFALVVRDARGLRSPEVIERLRVVLTHAASGQ